MDLLLLCIGQVYTDGILAKGQTSWWLDKYRGRETDERWTDI